MAIRSAVELHMVQRTQVSPAVAIRMLRRVATFAVMLPASREFTSDGVKDALRGHEEELALWTEFLDDKDGGEQVPLVKTLEVGRPGLEGCWSFQFKQ